MGNRRCDYALFHHLKLGKVGREQLDMGATGDGLTSLFLFFFLFMKKAESKIATRSANSIYSC